MGSSETGPETIPPQRDTLLGQIVLAIVAGALIGGAAPSVGQNVAFIGDIFLRALKMLVVPLVTLSILAGVTGLGDIRRLGPLGKRTVLYYFTTTGLAVALGIILVVLIQPGVGVTATGGELSANIAGKAGASAGMVIKDMLTGLLPANVVKAAAETDVLPLIIFSLLFGGVLTTMGQRARAVIDLIGVLNDAVMRLVGLIMRLAPLGIGCLVAGRLGEHGGFIGFREELQAIFRYAVTVLVGLAIHGMIILPLILAGFGRRGVWSYVKALSGALLAAFSTGSSSATLPLTYECTTAKAKVSRRTSSFVLPLGATVNMDGTALYEAVAAIFIAQVYQVHLDPAQHVVIFLTATLAAIGAAGIPEAGLVTMVIVLKAVNLPLEGIGLIVTIDWFLDRCRTTVNVWGDAVGAAVVDHWSGDEPDELAFAAEKEPDADRP